MITIYTKNNCPACLRAKALLNSKNLPFQARNVDEDLEAMDFIVEQRHRSLPVVYNGDVWVQDLSAL